MSGKMPGGMPRGRCATCGRDVAMIEDAQGFVIRKHQCPPKTCPHRGPRPHPCSGSGLPPKKISTIDTSAFDGRTALSKGAAAEERAAIVAILERNLHISREFRRQLESRGHSIFATDAAIRAIEAVLVEIKGRA